MLAGNVVALLAPCLFIPILTYAFGADNYDYESMRAIRRADDHDVAQEAHVDLDLVPGEHRDAAVEEAEQKQLDRAAFISRLITVLMTIALLILWPMPMYGSGYIFSKKFFTGWVSFGILWLFFSTYINPPAIRGFLLIRPVGLAWGCILCGRVDTRWRIRLRVSTTILRVEGNLPPQSSKLVWRAMILHPRKRRLL
jgi:hypothetical protein